MEFTENEDCEYELEGMYERYKKAWAKERQEEKEKLRATLLATSKESENFNIKKYSKYITNFEEKIKRITPVSYKDLFIQPYMKDDEFFVMYIYQKNKIVDIAATKHILNYLYNKEKHFLNGNYKLAVVKEKEVVSADAFLMTLRILHNLHIYNYREPNYLYISKTNLKPLVDAWGCNWYSFKKLMKEHNIKGYTVDGPVYYLKPIITRLIREQMQAEEA